MKNNIYVRSLSALTMDMVVQAFSAYPIFHIQFSKMNAPAEHNCDDTRTAAMLVNSWTPRCYVEILHSKAFFFHENFTPPGKKQIFGHGTIIFKNHGIICFKMFCAVLNDT